MKLKQRDAWRRKGEPGHNATGVVVKVYAVRVSFRVSYTSPLGYDQTLGPSIMEGGSGCELI